MSLVSVLLTALALSMDALAVSITKGMSIRNLNTILGVKIALVFGIFQGGMPIIGWLLGRSFESYIQSVDHWIAFILLSFLGVRMINEFIKSRKENNTDCCITKEEESISNKELIMLGIATSIDALAVGISFAVLNVNIVTTAIIIAIITFIACLFGVFLGTRIGDVLDGYGNLIGGIILILIGVNILNENTNIFESIINSIF